MSTTAPVTRSPNGVSCQVMTQVTPEEREKFQSVARAESRSLSATVRLLALRGLEQMNRHNAAS
ncbi:hypothetical protein [Modicisalibacter sp. MOD 31.J]|uniref:hypothetical protein n=1 Tax=Modicisalibacter sp. MOD 31.J TaxID=2831897 RepID=UPI001CCA9327|nr:hypothetical protein [Modicisalibacter sp. MOD 31.J]MBZ9576749.1 hypothetical protein [Modicisalibacter sp. MOD 31.J]